MVNFRVNFLCGDRTVCSGSPQKHGFAKADAVTASASTVEGNDQDQDQSVKEVAASVFPPSGCFFPKGSLSFTFTFEDQLLPLRITILMGSFLHVSFTFPSPLHPFFHIFWYFEYLRIPKWWFPKIWVPPNHPI